MRKRDEGKKNILGSIVVKAHSVIKNRTTEMRVVFNWHAQILSLERAICFL